MNDKDIDIGNPSSFQFSEKNVKRLKEKYLDEMRSEPDGESANEENPMRACMRIMFAAANESDSSKRAGLANQLSKLLIRPDGLINLFLALIDFDTSSQQRTTHNQRFLAVSNIIAHLPKLCLPYLDYCDNLRCQLSLILVHHDTKYSSLASLILKALLESPHVKKSQLQEAQVRHVLLDPFTEPLRKRVEGYELHHSILAVHNLIQNHVPTRLFVDYFPNLFYILVTLNDTPSSLKSYLKTTLSTILNDLQPGPACCLLEQTLFHQPKCNIYRIVAGDDHITVEVDCDVSARDFDQTKQVTLKLLEDCDSELLILEFFFHFQAKMWTSKHQDMGAECASLIEPLLEQTIEEKTSNKLDILKSIISNSQRALELISRTLLNYLEYLRLHQHDTNQYLEQSQNLVGASLKNCLDILEVLFTTQVGQAGIASLQNKIAHTLREIRSLVLRESAANRDRHLESNLNSLIEKLAGEPDYFQVPKAGRAASREYDEALSDLCNKLVPVRVHALVKLKNLVLAGDHFTVARIPQLYSMIECSLADREPYVFLAGINLMAELVTRKTAELLPELLKLYSKRELDVQQRINVGEVLVRVVRQMNEMTPHYAQQVLGAFVIEVSQGDNQELIKMSSLANMGEICRNLANMNALGKNIVEILACAERVCLHEDSLQTKCAAVEMLRAALMGLNGVKIESIQREIKSIYGLLKRLRQTTLDECLCLQVDLALDEIDRLAKELLGGTDSGGDRLVKNIKVLSLLD